MPGESYALQKNENVISVGRAWAQLRWAPADTRTGPGVGRSPFSDLVGRHLQLDAADVGQGVPPSAAAVVVVELHMHLFHAVVVGDHALACLGANGLRREKRQFGIESLQPRSSER